MIGWLIALGILILLVLIGQIRLKLDAESPEEGTPRVSARIGPVRLTLYPRKKKKKKPEKKPKKPKKKKKEKKKKGIQFSKDLLSLLLQLVPPVARAAGRLLRKIRIDRLDLHLIWGASDAAAAAIGYGRAQAAMGILWPCFSENFRIKSYDLTVDVDFEREKPAVIGQIRLSLTVAQILGVAVRLAFRAVTVLLKQTRHTPDKQKSGKKEKPNKEKKSPERRESHEREDAPHS